jgi:hypothetical protein
LTSILSFFSQQIPFPGAVHGTKEPHPFPQADPADREQALIIAESELVLLRVRAARVHVIEQMVPSTATHEPDVTRSGRYPFMRQQTIYLASGS